MQTFRQFLEHKFLAWQQQVGGRKTVKQFAEYLGVGQTTVSSWWNNNRKPEGENLLKLANRFGLEVYDVLGLPRPDESLHYIQRHWEDLPAEQQRALREQAEKYIAKNDRSKKD